jgi:hypothetical protein
MFAQAGSICYRSDTHRTGDGAVATRLCSAATDLACFVSGLNPAGNAFSMVVMMLAGGS